MYIENKIELFKIPNFVNCAICNKSLRIISNTHLKKHNINYKKYKESFPDKPTYCSNTLRKQSKARVIFYKKNPAKSIPNFYNDMKKFENRNKYTTLNKKVQNLEHVKNNKKKAAKNLWKNKEYITKQKNKNISEETKKKISINSSKYMADEQHRKEVSILFKKLWKDNDFKEKMSKIRIDLWKNKEFRKKMLNSRKKIEQSTEVPNSSQFSGGLL